MRSQSAFAVTSVDCDNSPGIRQGNLQSRDFWADSTAFEKGLSSGVAEQGNAAGRYDAILPHDQGAGVLHGYLSLGKLSGGDVGSRDCDRGPTCYWAAGAVWGAH